MVLFKLLFQVLVLGVALQIVSSVEYATAEGTTLFGVIHNSETETTVVNCRNLSRKKGKIRVRFFDLHGNVVGRRAMRLKKGRTQVRLPKKLRTQNPLSLTFEIRIPERIHVPSCMSTLVVKQTEELSEDTNFPTIIELPIFQDSPALPESEDSPDATDGTLIEVDCRPADLNRDGHVSILDYLLALESFLAGGPVTSTELEFIHSCFGTSFETINQPPQVSAGDDQSLALPSNTLTLYGIVTDDGFPQGSVAIAWSQIGGPGGAQLMNSNFPVTRVTFSQSGTYTFLLHATDGELSAEDEVTVSVTEPPGSGIPVLVPGPGFQEVTTQPPVQGNPTDIGYDAKAIARWDVVPYQTFHGEFQIGVVAFHIAGIDRVEFSVEGGPWLPARALRLNPRTNVWEYFVALDSEVFSDGPIEVRAIAYPRAGIPRVLEGPPPLSAESDNGENSMFLFADSGEPIISMEVYVSPQGSDILGDGTRARPFRTIMQGSRFISATQGTADGGIIYLEEGDYPWGPESWPTPTTVDRWLTIKPAPGVHQSQVRITSNESGIKTKLVHLQDVTVTQTGKLTTSNNGLGTQPMGGAWLWIDHVSFTGDETRTLWPTGGWSGQFITDCWYDQTKRAAESSALVRNTIMTNIGEQATSDSKLVVNSQVHEINSARNRGVYHPDVHMFRSGVVHENVILMNYQAYDGDSPGGAQGIFIKQPQLVKDVAIVNTFMESGNNRIQNERTENLLVWNSTFVGGSWIWGELENTDLTLSGIDFRNSIITNQAASFTRTQAQVLLDPDWYHSNHFISGIALGSDLSLGNLLFMNEASNDFRPVADSVAAFRSSPTVPFDANGQLRGTISALGAFISEGEE
ncbi:MAG: hypothetical protein KDD64_12010 [Bdellovibrionales bacterium]|nr:hypothetical protein [Bdellovibrionales bacterium]